MKLYKKILLALFIIAVLYVLTVFTGFYFVQKPTGGTTISVYDKPRKAVLVIDIQEDYTGATAPMSSPYLKNSAEFIGSVNGVIESARAKKIPVVYIRQEFEGWGKFLAKMVFMVTTVKGSNGAAVDKRVAMVSEHNFPKPIGDAFSNPALEEFLIRNKINELHLTGLDAEYCVYSTARGALNRGYKITIITDAVRMGNARGWDKQLEKYRKDGMRLLTVKDFQALD